MGLRSKDILSVLEDKTRDYQDKIALGTKDVYGWKEFTYKGIGQLSRKVARYVIEELNIPKGEKLAILSESKPEYATAVFASALSGMVTVPLDVKLTKYELKSILMDAQPTVLFTSQYYLETARALKEEIPSIKYIFVLDQHSKHTDVINVYDVPDIFNAKWRRRSPKSTAFIIYTSGTTGQPKGVEITFANITSQLEDLGYALAEILEDKKVTCLSILPMNHLFEMTVGFCTFLNYGFSVYYTQSLKPKDILGIMQEKKVEFMIVVPAFLKLLKAGIETELKNAPKITQFLFNTMYHIAKFIPSYAIKKVLFKKIHDKFGGNFIGCISGGAPLDIGVGNFFERIGIKVYQGYGLSETSPVVCVNTDRRNDLASVGRPLKHFEARIDSQTGELQLKGPSVMKGYHNQPELTSEVIDEDGWLHTGDIAKIDRGHIYITGRIKNMIVLAGGKKVFPEEVEAVLEKSEYLAETCVMGINRSFGAKDGMEEVTAIVVPKEDLYKNHSDEEVEKMVRDDIKALSMQLTQYKRPSTVIIKKEPLPRTTTRKVKRNEVKKLIEV
ncbi:MAG: AMP-binding protein [Candidatus Gastranaerophilales bacterium]|nr:AMP-binding protein [Candidatus Gastranaerophilales bacterium]